MRVRYHSHRRAHRAEKGTKTKELDAGNVYEQVLHPSPSKARHDGRSAWGDRHCALIGAAAAGGPGRSTPESGLRLARVSVWPSRDFIFNYYYSFPPRGPPFLICDFAPSRRRAAAALARRGRAVTSREYIDLHRTPRGIREKRKPGPKKACA